MFDPCAKCEEVLQPFLDRELSDAEHAQAEAHLDQCAYCRRRYRFEERLRMYVRQAWAEQMPPDLKAKLAALRTPLYSLGTPFLGLLPDDHHQAERVVSAGKSPCADAELGGQALGDPLAARRVVDERALVVPLLGVGDGAHLVGEAGNLIGQARCGVPSGRPVEDVHLDLPTGG